MRRSVFLLSLAALTLVMASSAYSATERVIDDAYLTAYSWYDNTPPGSGEISYPTSGGHPTEHDNAGGSGTYADPITLAVGWSTASGESVSDWPVGERFYLPAVRKYAIVEDACGNREPPQSGPCHSLEEAPDGATTWLDVWIGGQGHSRSATQACMQRLTGLHTVILRPKPDYPVNEGDIVDACASGRIYPDSVPEAMNGAPGPATTRPSPRHQPGDDTVGCGNSQADAAT